jgi:hypothetical protein
VNSQGSAGLIKFIVGVVLGVLTGGVAAIFLLSLGIIVFLLVIIVGLLVSKEFVLGYVVGALISPLIFLFIIF